MQGTILHFTEQLTQPLYLDLTVLPQGMSSGSSGQTVRDTVRVIVRSGSAPYEVVESVKGFLDINGSVIITLNNCAYNVPYYLEVDHRNTIETWSANTIVFTANSLPYDFTLSDYQAYGQNLVAIGPYWYALYSGDVNKDGIIDISDMAMIDNDVLIHATGYRNTDIDGNLSVDASDYLIADRNAEMFISLMRP
jgi:hypothetical protein